MLVPLKDPNKMPVLSWGYIDNAYNASMKIQELENELINGEKKKKSQSCKKR